jgi:hypothetical protein
MAGGVVGASVFASTYSPSITDRLAASTAFDGYLLRAFAHTVQRFYYGQDNSGNGVYPTSSDVTGTGGPATMSAAGIRLVVSFKPTIDPAGAYTASKYTTQKSNLISAISLLKSHHVTMDGIALYHEGNGHGANGPFATAALFKAYQSFYGAAVQAAGIPLYYIPAMYSATTAVSYYPGDSLCDAVLADYYCNDFTGSAITLDAIMAVADAGSKPFGIGEWGFSNGSARPSPAQFVSWCNDQILGRWEARATAGKPAAALMWYSRDAGGPNSISATTDPSVIAELDLLYDTLNASAPSAGPAAQAPAWPGSPEPGSFTPGDISVPGAAATVTVSTTLTAIASPVMTVTGGTGAVVTTPATMPAAPAGMPQIIAEIGVIPAVPVPPPGTLELDDATFGRLNLNVLAGTTVWADISRYVRSGSITRTSTRQQAPVITYDAGTLTAVLKDADGRFDPDNLTGPYVAAGVSQVRPMTPVRARAAYQGVVYPLFNGFADSWITPDTNFGPRYSETTVSATDAFKVLGGYQLGAAAQNNSVLIPVGSGEDTGARMSRLLNLAGWDTNARSIDTGNTDLQGTSLTGPAALDEMRLAADTELGELYVNGSGQVVFRRRRGVLEDARSTNPQATFGDSPGAGATLNSNTGFEGVTGSTAGWATSNGAALVATSVGAYAGVFCGLMSGDGVTANPTITTTPAAAVTPGAYVTFSAWVIAASNPWPMTMTIQFFDSGSAHIAGADAVAILQADPSGWAQITTAGFAPATAASCTGVLTMTGTPASPGPAVKIDEAYLQVTAELPYTGVGRSSDDGQLCNDAQITAAGSANLQEALDAGSVATFGYPRSYSRTDVLLQSDAEALEYAQFLVYISKGAEDRFDTLTVNPLRDPARLFPQVLGREIGDMIQVIRRPPGMPAIVKQLIIRGVSHTVDISSNTWSTQWQLQDASRYAFLTLGDPVAGRLDDNALAF